MEKVSIIIPTYNVEKYIKNCLDSILMQSFVDFVVYIIDDASTDGTHAIIRQYQKLDERIQGIFKEENSGPSISRNIGIDIAKGEFIIFIDSDDWLTDEHALEEYMNAMKTKDYDCVCCGYFTVHSFGTIKKTMKKKYLGEKNSAMLILDKLKTNNPYYHYVWNKCYRTSVLKKHGIIFEPHKNTAEDVKFNNEFLRVSNNYYLLDMPLYSYNCLNQESLTRKKTTCKLDENTILINRWTSIFKEREYQYGLVASVDADKKAYAYIDSMAYMNAMDLLQRYKNNSHYKKLVASDEWKNLCIKIGYRLYWLNVKCLIRRINFSLKKCAKSCIQMFRH